MLAALLPIIPVLPVYPFPGIGELITIILTVR